MEINTKRLIIRSVTVEDATFIADLWNNPKVMRFVGFPMGLNISRQKVIKTIESANEVSLLTVTLRDGERIGNAKIGDIDENGIIETDVKLKPGLWGKGYGKEIKKALVDYIFQHTKAEVIQATPNIQNIASIKMQEYVNAKPAGEGVFEFPENMKDHTCPVNYIVYQINRKDWEKNNKKG